MSETLPDSDIDTSTDANEQGTFLDSISSALDNLQLAIEESKDSDGNTRPILAVFNWLVNLTKDKDVDSMTSADLNTSFTEYLDTTGMELNETNRNIMSWTNESIDFWRDQNIVSSSLFLPRSTLLGLHFGIIERESGFNTMAQNPSSSASGLGQFLKGTWKHYIDKYRDKLLGSFSADELDAQWPDATTKNPRLTMFLMTAYILDSYRVLSHQGLLENGNNDPRLGWKIYVLNHYGHGDGPKHIRWHAAQGNPTLQNEIRRTMVFPQYVEIQEGDENDYMRSDREGGVVIQNWIGQFSGNSSREMV